MLFCHSYKLSEWAPLQIFANFQMSASFLVWGGCLFKLGRSLNFWDVKRGAYSKRAFIEVGVLFQLTERGQFITTVYFSFVWWMFNLTLLTWSSIPLINSIISPLSYLILRILSSLIKTSTPTIMLISCKKLGLPYVFLARL